MTEDGLARRQEDAGARRGRLHGREGALDFGDPEEEYRRLRGGPSILDDADRTLLEIRGERAREHFGGLVTNHLEGTSPGDGVYAFMLTPQGRPVAELRALCLDPADGVERILVDLPGACGDAALEHLGRYLPPRLARRTERDDLHRLGVTGPGAEAAVTSVADLDPERNGLPAGPLSHRSVTLRPGGERVLLVRAEACEGGGLDLYVPRAVAADAWEALARAGSAGGGGPVGLRAREVVRVERGVPVGGREITPEVLPQETGQEERAISHEKGCYTGQEVVAKIHYRGRVNRHLRGLRLEGDGALPEADAELFDDERSRGRVTTAVVSPALGPLALGYLHRSVEPGGRVSLSSGGAPEAEVVELPFEVPGTG